MLKSVETKLAFIAGPLGGVGRCEARDQFERTVMAAQYGEIAAGHGYTPFLPHLFWFWATLLDTALERDDWIRFDNEMVRRSDLLIRVPGSSPGGDAEVELARSLSIPVVEPMNLRDLNRLLNRRPGRL